MIRCTECNKDLVKHTKSDDWLLLVHYIGMMVNEEVITNTTYEAMMNALMSFKSYAMDWDKNDKEV